MKGSVLQKLRVDRNLQQAEVARAAGMTRQALRSIEATDNVGPETVRKVAAALFPDDTVVVAVDLWIGGNLIASESVE